MSGNINNQNVKNEDLKTSESFPLATQASGVEVSTEQLGQANSQRNAKQCSVSERIFDEFDYMELNGEELELYQEIMYKYTNDELTLADLENVLSKTIYEDRETKIILLLSGLLTFTAAEQRNAILTGESAIGKTHNITEVLWFYRRTDDAGRIIEVSSASPRSFIHQANALVVDERNCQPIDFTKAPKKGDKKEAWEEWNDLMRHTAYFLDFANKIVVFLDIPDFKLLESLRSLLSHDRKICKYLITDKSTKGAAKTKTVLIQGYFTAIFASAYSALDEQESTRNFLLSPTDNPAKIQKAIELQARKKVDPHFADWYEREPSRCGLRDRVGLISISNIENILFKKKDMENLKQWFFKNTDCLSPKAQRDFPRLYALAEAWALLNYMHRERNSDGSCIYANVTDIEVAKKIYEPILKCNEFGLTPEEYAIWKIVEPHCTDLMGLRINEIHNIYYNEKKRRCSDKRLREMLKKFVCAGLLKEEKEGVIIKYYSITHKQTKQAELAKSKDNSAKRCSSCGSTIANESYSGLCSKCEQEAIEAASEQSTGAGQ